MRAISESLSVACPCGKTHTFCAGHYDRVLVSCGRPYWALRPRRNGPLQLYPWPGPNLTRAEYLAKHGDQ